MNRIGIHQIECEVRNAYGMILLDEIKDRMMRLRSFGFSNEQISCALSGQQHLQKIIITKGHQIILSEGIEIEMQPLVKAVFFLFLKHPEGIRFKQLPDYREELASIYKELRPLGLNKRTLQSIEDVTNPLLNSINEKCARIRSAFVKQFDEHLAKNYFVTGERGMPKKITLPRDLVVWEE